jgi:hypothetical protein
MVARVLGLPEERLVDLAALCGNDITWGVIAPLWSTLNVSTSTMKQFSRCRRVAFPEAAADALRMFPGALESLPAVKTNPELAAALAASRAFYSKKKGAASAAASCPSSGALRSLDDLPEGLRARVANADLPDWVLSVVRHASFWGYSQDCRDSQLSWMFHANGRWANIPCTANTREGWASPISYFHRLLRSQLYSMLRPAGSTPVIEMAAWMNGKDVRLKPVNCPSPPIRTSLTITWLTSPTSGGLKKQRAFG